MYIYDADTRQNKHIIESFWKIQIKKNPMFKNIKYNSNHSSVEA